MNLREPTVRSDAVTEGFVDAALDLIFNTDLDM
jgi:hypothetical protein